MIFKGPFQPKPFCNSVFLCTAVFQLRQKFDSMQSLTKKSDHLSSAMTLTNLLMSILYGFIDVLLIISVQVALFQIVIYFLCWPGIFFQVNAKPKLIHGENKQTEQKKGTQSPEVRNKTSSSFQDSVQCICVFFHASKDIFVDSSWKKESYFLIKLYLVFFIVIFITPCS